MSALLVTTSSRPDPLQVARAREVAARCGAPLAHRRGSLPRLLQDHGATVAYVVERDREVLADGRQTLFVERGLLHARLGPGLSHPLLRALGPAARVVDGTLGLAQDALHVAAASGAEVIGVEASPALATLCEAGLGALARGGLEAAARVSVLQGDSREVLASLTADAVMLSPMFDTPLAAAPGWDLLRPLARGAPLDARWLEAALRCAPTVVVKVRRGQPVPEGLGRSPELLRGKAVDYWRFGRGPT